MLLHGQLYMATLAVEGSAPPVQHYLDATELSSDGSNALQGEEAAALFFSS